MSDLVTDLPIWEACPFRGMFPPHIEIRRGNGIVVFWHPAKQEHVDIDEPLPDGFPSAEVARHISRSLPKRRIYHGVGAAGTLARQRRKASR